MVSLFLNLSLRAAQIANEQDAEQKLTIDSIYKPVAVESEETERINVLLTATKRALPKDIHKKIISFVRCFPHISLLFSYQVKSKVYLPSEIASCVDIYPTGKFLAVGYLNGALLLLDATTGKQIRSFMGHPHGVARVKFDPRGEFLVSSGKKDGVVRLHSNDRRLQPLSFTYKLDMSYRSDIVFDIAPCGKYMVVGSQGSEVIELLDLLSFDAHGKPKIIKTVRMKSSSPRQRGPG